MSAQPLIESLTMALNPSTRSEQLVSVAEQLLDEAGPHALSLRRIAEAAETSTQAVYTEFGGKQGLADVLFRAGFERLASHLPTSTCPMNRSNRLWPLASATAPSLVPIRTTMR